jgi:protein tyrosine phosphatase
MIPDTIVLLLARLSQAPSFMVRVCPKAGTAHLKQTKMTTANIGRQPMTKIYLVWYYNYQDSCVVGVFDSIQKAKELKSKLEDSVKQTMFFDGSYGIMVHELNKEDEGEATDD